MYIVSFQFRKGREKKREGERRERQAGGGGRERRKQVSEGKMQKSVSVGVYLSLNEHREGILCCR